MHEFPVCCGAMYDPGGTDSRGWDPQDLLCEEELGYIFTDVELPGFEKICDGLFYIHNDDVWERPTDVAKWGQYPNSMIQWNMNYPIPYVTEGYSVFHAHLLCNFPHGPYEIKDKVLKLIEANSKTDSLCILNQEQAAMFEDLILSCGYEVINRTYNPKHDSKIVLYYRSPKEFNIVQTA